MVGNHTSVLRCVKQLGFKAQRTKKISGQADLLLLLGVYVQELHRSGLVEYLQLAAKIGRPLIGICLGMQLLTF